MDTKQDCCGQQLIAAEPISQISQEKFYSDKELNSQARLDICKTCPELLGPLNNCRQCGCFMNIKVRIYSATCPLGKW